MEPTVYCVLLVLEALDVACIATINAVWAPHWIVPAAYLLYVRHVAAFAAGLGYFAFSTTLTDSKRRMSANAYTLILFLNTLAEGFAAIMQYLAKTGRSPDWGLDKIDPDQPVLEWSKVASLVVLEIINVLYCIAAVSDTDFLDSYRELLSRPVHRKYAMHEEPSPPRYFMPTPMSQPTSSFAPTFLQASQPLSQPQQAPSRLALVQLPQAAPTYQTPGGAYVQYL
jgi:hypothetical protein